MSVYLMEAPELTGAAIHCPGCTSAHTTVVTTSEKQNVLCKTCGTCWHLAEGIAERIDPQQCPGCAFQRICFAAAG